MSKRKQRPTRGTPVTDDMSERDVAAAVGISRTTLRNWVAMAAIPDDRKLSELSIPGTHDTMAKYGGDVPECQSMTLSQQLASGIRWLVGTY